MALTLGFDVETTKLPFAFPWQKESTLVSVGLANEKGWKKTWTFNHEEDQFFAVEIFIDGTKTLHRYFAQREMIDDIQQHINVAHRLVGHNLKFDLNWLNYLGVDYSRCRLWCTMVTEYLLRGQRLGQLTLHDLSKQYLSIDKIDLVQTMWVAGYETTEIPLRILLPYLEQDCINALAIYQKQVPKIRVENMTTLTALMNESTRCLSAIECNGMMVDLDEAKKHVKDLTLKLATLDAELKLLFNFDINLSSKDELSAGLYGGVVKREKEEWYYYHYKRDPETKYDYRMVAEDVPIKGLGFKVTSNMRTKKKGVYQTNKNTIKHLKATNKTQRKVKKSLVERSKVAKALETLQGKDKDKGIINKIQADGLVHPQYNQAIAKTGRLSSKDPNGQNLPREGTSPVKLSIVARNDYILEVDLSQIEWRVAAWLSQDPVILREIKDGVDPHTDNAIKIFGADPNGNPKKFKQLRTIAKIVTFRLLYGGTYLGFYFDQAMPNFSKKKWKQIVDAFWEKYRGLAEWQANNRRTVWKQKGILQNPTGRKFIFRKDPAKGYKNQQIANFPVQSLATADIMILAMVLIYRKYVEVGFKSLVVGQVHDALVFDCLEEELPAIVKMSIGIFDKLPEYLEKYFGFEFNVPLTGDAEIGKSWGSLEEYKLAT
jgi:DNA polymerase I-like protein with 3'-5' exonuclease and polymerase domains